MEHAATTAPPLSVDGAPEGQQEGQPPDSSGARVDIAASSPLREIKWPGFGVEIAHEQDDTGHGVPILARGNRVA